MADVRMNAGGGDGAAQVALIGNRTDGNADESDLLHQHEGHGDVAIAEALESTHDRDGTAGRGGLDRFGDRAGSADVDDDVDSPPAGELARRDMPLRCRAVVDQMVGAELL